MARSVTEVREAQRLRFRVFAEEMGARVANGEVGIDGDALDAYCEHLLVRDSRSGDVVGTYRMLDWDHARRAGGFYAQSEFDLTRVRRFLPRVLEVGRACVHPAYRRGAVITMLWGGILRQVRMGRHSAVMGCASIPAADANLAVSICRQLLQDHLGPAGFRVTPYRPFLLEGRNDGGDVPIPSLIKGYLRLGAFVCGAPAWDPDFGTADLLLWLPADRISDRYVNRLLRAA
jgi:putative hemolysin